MTKEEMLKNLGIALDNFTPQPNNSIMVTIDSELISIDLAGKIIEIIREEYPEKNILMTTKGINIK